MVFGHFIECPFKRNVLQGQEQQLENAVIIEKRPLGILGTVYVFKFRLLPWFLWSEQPPDGSDGRIYVPRGLMGIAPRLRL
jgi:hypothetical protein